MIDSFNVDSTGWARFSTDGVFRYRLARSLTGFRLVIENGRVEGLRRVVWLLLNPSNADAFKPDPTVTNCMKFAHRFGADVTEVVNLFAFRSPKPAKLLAAGVRGDDAIADAEIFAACEGAALVIAAWGNHGRFDQRDEAVRSRLAQREITLHHLGLTRHGAPKHPMARGVHRIPDDQQPAVWA